MVKKSKKIGTGIAVILAVCLAGLLLVNLAGSRTEAVSAAEMQWTDAVRITLDNDTMTAVFEDTGAPLTDEDYVEREIGFNGTELVIENAGTYILSGTMKGKISISSSKKKDVVLVLDGLTVENDTDEALTVKKTGTLTLFLNEGTENIFTSGKEKTEDPEAEEEAAAVAAATEEEVPEDDASGGALHIKSDTYIQGTGSLTVNGYINNGIHVTKTLSIDEGNITVNAVNNGIKAKEYFFMGDGSLTIQAGNDGIKAEKDAEIAAAEVTDPNTGEVLKEAEIAEPEKGDILIDGGKIDIGCYGSGFQARLNVVVNGGDITINSSKDAINADHIVRINDGNLTLDTYQDGMQAGEDLTISGGTISIKTEGDYKHKSGEGESFGGRSSSSSNTPSRKGLKSDGNLTITAGTISIDASDDAVHCAERLKIEGGDLTISTGDDGLHADFYLDIMDGTVNILTSYEGIEANQISVYGGDVSVIASDDGFNGNGGSGSFGGPGGGSTTTRRATETPNLNISGGTVYVNSGGDGLDSNGNITISGGFIVVDGPTSSMNGALDGGAENGGVIKISNGTVFAGGASGMAEGFSGNSSQCSFMCTFSTSYRAGAKFTISDMAGNVLFTHTAGSGGNSMVFSCPELTVGETYILKIAEYEMELTLNKVSSSFRIASDGSVTAGNGGSGGGPGR